MVICRQTVNMLLADAAAARWTQQARGSHPRRAVLSLRGDLPAACVAFQPCKRMHALRNAAEIMPPSYQTHCNPNATVIITVASWLKVQFGCCEDASPSLICLAQRSWSATSLEAWSLACPPPTRPFLAIQDRERHCASKLKPAAKAYALRRTGQGSWVSEAGRG